MSSKSKKNQEELTDKQQEQPAETVVEQQEVMQQEPLIYVGPSLPNGLATKYTTFSNGIPVHLSIHFEKCPAFKQLFIPVRRLAETEKRLNDATSAESVFYQQTVKYFVRKG
ncbi:MAG: hypothetical protein K6T85_00660 [Gorillibacterium sp.]|nr:hypothetical protein [Gorillibacterium sp.]